MILVAGSANLDFVVRASRIPRPGETVLGRDFKTFPGGKGANQAIACARAGGVETEMLLSPVDDAFDGEAHRRDFPGIDRHHRALDGLGRSPRVVTLAQLVERDPALIGEQPDRPTPDRCEDPGPKQHRYVVVRRGAEPEADPRQRGRAVGAADAALRDGDPNGTAGKVAPRRPRGWYPLSKSVGEELCDGYWRTYRTPITTLRFALTVGAGEILHYPQFRLSKLKATYLDLEPHWHGEEQLVIMRDHNGRAMVAWMAGGGVKGGQAYGATDEFGSRTSENKAHIHDLTATPHPLLGFDPA